MWCANPKTRTLTRTALAASLVCALATSCQTPESAFVGNRLLELCDWAYYICGVPSGCVLDNSHYVEGRFPGVRRVVVETEDSEKPVQVRILMTTMEAQGTELLVQMYEPDCTINPQMAREHIQDEDVFEVAGDDGILLFDFTAMQEGEHLIELYSDTSADYLLLVDTLPPE